ncbi:Conserved_hypothetical protein [Hexamita inflata]|uniref:Uncharacterized protein n=1 Tax=Hexamita inflata TaxID=28002 RepID=A0AA86R992_9EUKA|nr:Conserved hypothetical protein [Hexamita inflata]
MSQIVSLDEILDEAENSKQNSTTKLIKLPPPNVLRTTAARKNYQSQMPQPMEHIPNQKLKETKKTLQKLQEVQSQYSKTVTSKINYFDKTAVMDTDLILEEKRQAALMSQFGICNETQKNNADALLLSSSQIVFSQYQPNEIYKSIFQVTNTGKSGRKVKLMPPVEPFFVQTLNFTLQPGQIQNIEVIFRPDSFSPQKSNIMIQSGEWRQEVPIVAFNTQAQFVIKQLIIDSVTEPNISLSRELQNDATTINISTQPLVKLYDTPHQIRLLIENDSTNTSPAKHSRYAQKKLEPPIHNPAHVTDLKMHSDKIQMSLNRENCVNVEFNGENNEEEIDFAQLSKLQQFYYLERINNLNDYFQDEPENKPKPDWQFKMLAHGVVCLDLIFNDDVGDKTNTIVLQTAEGHVLTINLKIEISNGSVALTECGQPLKTPVNIPIDVKSSLFNKVFEQNRLTNDRVIPISRSLNTNEQKTVDVKFQVSGLNNNSLKFFLRPYSEHLAMGYLSDNYIPQVKSNFALNNIQIGNSMVKATMQMTNDQAPLQAVLDFAYIYNERIYTLFRFIFTIDPIITPPAQITLQKSREQDLQNLEMLSQPKSTDYLLISEPALDLGVIPVQKGATFKFQIKNCSKDVFIPFIVAPNLHSSLSSLTSVPQDFGVKFKWSRAEDQVESEIVFADVLDVLGSKMKQWTNINTEAQKGFPETLKSFRQQLLVSARERQTEDCYKMKLPSIGKQNSSQRVELEPIQVYPECGIVPPGQSVTVNVRVTPVTVGPIDAFIVINTPATKYYETISQRIQMLLDQPKTNPHSSQSARTTSTLLTRTVVPQNLVLQQQYIQKCIPNNELQRIFSNNSNNIHEMEGGLLSDRDVFCRVYGVVAIPQVQFQSKVIKNDSDQLKPVQIQLQNFGQAQTEIEVAVIKGDAQFVPKTEMPQHMNSLALQVWAKQAKLLNTFKITLGPNEIQQIMILPGLEDSVIVARKPINTFGNMSALLDQNLIDQNQNFIVAACRVLKRLEPLKPFIYLDSEPQTKYIVLSPCSRNMKQMRIVTRPYQPIKVDFTIVNPASSQFCCEIQTGRDLVAPSAIKIGPQEKAKASFAINPDHSGEMETFITFHDCNMRIVVSAYGPDISLRCPALRSFEKLSSHQGMVKQQGRSRSSESLQWDDLLSEIPYSVKLAALQAGDEINESELYQEAEPVQEQHHNIQEPLDFSLLRSKSHFKQIMDNVPVLEFENLGGPTSKPINLTVVNPTGSSLKVEPKAVPLDRPFVTLSLSKMGSTHKLNVGGLFENTQELQSPFFVATPSVAEIQKNQSSQIELKAVNMKNFGTYEAMLQVQGLFIKLKCNRQVPGLKLCDNLKLVQLESCFGIDKTCQLELISEALNALKIKLEVESPFKLNKTEYDVGASEKVKIQLQLEAKSVFNLIKHTPQKNLVSIKDHLNAELAPRQILSELRVYMLDCLDEHMQPQILIFPIQLQVSAPRIDPRYTYLKFKPIFRNQEHVLIKRLENPTNHLLKYTIVHIPINDVVALRRMEFTLNELENVQHMRDERAQIQASANAKIIKATESSFTQFDSLYYDSLDNQLIIDDPLMFGLSSTKGQLENSGNEKPFKYTDLQVRFQPDNRALDWTNDRTLQITYQSFYYIQVEGGQGAFLRCRGKLNDNVREV